MSSQPALARKSGKLSIFFCLEPAVKMVRSKDVANDQKMKLPSYIFEWIGAQWCPSGNQSAIEPTKRVSPDFLARAGWQLYYKLSYKWFYFHLQLQHLWQPKWLDPVWAAGICRVILLWAGLPMPVLDSSCCGGANEVYILWHT